jgi:murein DD-endopeptidase MepM/ murein hydrolase activator NlpD
MPSSVGATSEKSAPAMCSIVTPSSVGATSEKSAPARTLDLETASARALEAVKAVNAFHPARTVARTLPASQPASPPASEADTTAEAARALVRMRVQALKAQKQEETSKFLEASKALQVKKEETAKALAAFKAARQDAKAGQQPEQPQPEQEKPEQKKPEQEGRRSPHQQGAQDLAALCSGLPTYSVSAGVVSSA